MTKNAQNSEHRPASRTLNKSPHLHASHAETLAQERRAREVDLQKHFLRRGFSADAAQDAASVLAELWWYSRLLQLLIDETLELQTRDDDVLAPGLIPSAEMLELDIIEWLLPGVKRIWRQATETQWTSTGEAREFVAAAISWWCQRDVTEKVASAMVALAKSMRKALVPLSRPTDLDPKRMKAAAARDKVLRNASRVAEEAMLLTSLLEKSTISARKGSR